MLFFLGSTSGCSRVLTGSVEVKTKVESLKCYSAKKIASLLCYLRKSNELRVCVMLALSYRVEARLMVVWT